MHSATKGNINPQSKTVINDMHKLILRLLLCCDSVSMRVLFLPLVLLLGGSLHVANASGGTQEPRPSSKELVETVLTGINHNNSRMPSLRATFEALVQNVDLDKEINQTVTEKTGGTVKLVIEPRSESSAQYILRGNDVKFESEGATWVIKNGAVTQYSPEDHSAWIHRLHQIPAGSFPPIDFRNVGITVDNRPMVQILQEDKVLAAEFVEIRQKKMIRITLESKRGFKATYEFDPSRNLLPATAYALNPDGSNGQVAQLDYQECAPGTWILKTARIESFPSKEGLFGSKVILSLKLNSLDTNFDVSDQTFELDYTRGTLVHDNVQGKTYVVGVGQAPHKTSLRNWLWVIFAIPLVVYLLFRIAKHFKWFRFGKT
jgi:hypothetical protein